MKDYPTDKKRRTRNCEGLSYSLKKSVAFRVFFLSKHYLESEMLGFVNRYFHNMVDSAFCHRHSCLFFIF